MNEVLVVLAAIGSLAVAGSIIGAIGKLVFWCIKIEDRLEKVEHDVRWSRR